MNSVFNFFAIEVRNEDGNWKELSVVHREKYFEDPNREFMINKDDENKLKDYKETTKSPVVRLITTDYNKQANTITNYIVIEFYKWAIIDGKIIALADSAEEYSLTKEEYNEQRKLNK